MVTEDLNTRPQLGPTPSVIIFEYLSQSREVDVADSRNTSDVIIYCSNGALMAHQLILASISPLLCSEFANRSERICDEGRQYCCNNFEHCECASVLVCWFVWWSSKMHKAIPKLSLLIPSLIVQLQNLMVGKH